MENVKLYAKISAKAALKWMFIVFTGVALTSTFMLIVLFQSLGASYGGGMHTGGFLPALIVVLAVKNICGFILLIGAPVFFVCYFVVANKIAIQTILYGLWVNKAVKYVEPALNKVIAKITARHDWIRTASDEAMLKARLLDETRRDSSISGVNKRVINYAVKRMKMDDIDFQDENLQLADVISVKLTQFISETLEPGFLLFWILSGVQIILFIFAQIYKLE